VEVARVGTLWERREYELVDQNGDERVLLVGGFTPGKKDWCLMTPLLVQNPLTPTQAAIVQAGHNLKMDGESVLVSELFQATVRRVDPAGSTHPATGDMWYGFAGQSGSTPILVKWNHEGITYFRGKTFRPEEIKSAFSSP
jgi:hypothetical protein